VRKFEPAACKWSLCILQIVVLTLNAISIGGQNSKPPVSEQGAPSQSGSGDSMGLPFKTGKLPEPARKPSGSVDEVAALLAKQISARDEQSVPALLTAILNSGIGLRDRDGSVLQTVDPGQGLLFDAWEVASMAKMYGDGKRVPLQYLTESLKLIPDLKDVPLDAALLEGIRDRAQGSDPLMRFWARFLVELGRQQEKPYDLLNANAKDVQLDAIQSALVLRRLVGDLYVAGQKNNRTSQTRFEEHSTPIRSLPRLVRFSPSIPHMSQTLFIAPSWQSIRQLSAVGKPCEGLGGDPIQDVLATEVTGIWDNLFGDTKLGKAVGIANVVLAYAKFIAAYATLETEITVANPPVIRTRNATPDRTGRRQLTAKVTMNLGKWDQINCFRSALNLFTGLDFNLLDDGPIEGVEVNWHLDQGGAGDFYSNRTGVTGNRQIVGFVNDGPRIQDAGTYAGASGRSGVAVGNATRGKTDKEGKTSVYLEGSPKIPYVAPPFVPVMKQAVVRTTIKMKAGDIKGDAADLWGQLRGGLSGLITMPLELLYRTDWASTATLAVPVRDHEPCEGGWYGTVTMSEDYWNPPSGFIQVNGHSYDEVFKIEASKGVASGNFKSLFREEGRAAVANACTQFRRVTTVGTAEREARFSVLMEEGSENYKVWVTSPSIPAKQDNEVSACGYGNPHDRSWSETTTVGGFSTGLEGRLDPKNPGVLSGSTVIPSLHGSRKITWTLRKCQ
jgi:hypothetical protein